MRISDWSSYVCSSDLRSRFETAGADRFALRGRRAVADIFEARHRSTGTGADDFVPDRQLARTHRQALARIQPSVDHHDLVALVGARKTDREIVIALVVAIDARPRSEEHTSELQSLMRISYAVFCLKTKKTNKRP